MDWTLHDERLMSLFRDGGELPVGFGRGFDERIVEYPWVFANLPSKPAVLLDAGSALNYGFLVCHPLLCDKRLHIVTLAPESNCFWQRSVSYFYDDLLSLPMRDGLYDIVACISTLEHVGFDNAQYTGAPAAGATRPNDYRIALEEMQRVLRPGGILFITVPYGQYERFATFQQFDAKMIADVKEAVRGDCLDERYFRYTTEGWQRATAEQCAEARYASWTSAPPSQRSPVFIPDPDCAAAARAVACLAFRKSPRSTS